MMSFIKHVWTALLFAVLVIFMLLSLNNLLPLKRRFPAWKLSPNLVKVTNQTTEETRTDYVNAKGNTTVALDKNFATVIKTTIQTDQSPEDGYSILEQYYDNHQKPSILMSGNSALRRECNADGKWFYTTYLDSNLTPVVSTHGYASIHRTFNDLGKVEDVTYYDADDKPTRDIYLRYGYRNEYDEDGRLSVVTNLDANGNPMISRYRYAIKKITYSPDGRLYMEMFYDTDGNPVQLSYGQYGYVYENGKPICVDRNGNKIFTLRYFLFHSIFAVLVIGILLLVVIILSGRAVNWLLLFLYLAFIAYMTIYREAGSAVITWHIPPNYYLFFTNREILSNIWLFIPLGAILYKLSHIWEIVVLPIALTLAVEISQLVFGVGAFEISDLIANSLGGVIGAIACYLLEAVITRDLILPAPQMQTS